MRYVLPSNTSGRFRGTTPPTVAFTGCSLLFADDLATSPTRFSLDWPSPRLRYVPRASARSSVLTRWSEAFSFLKPLRKAHFRRDGACPSNTCGTPSVSYSPSGSSRSCIASGRWGRAAARKTWPSELPDSSLFTAYSCYSRSDYKSSWSMGGLSVNARRSFVF